MLAWSKEGIVTQSTTNQGIVSHRNSAERLDLSEEEAKEPFKWSFARPELPLPCKSHFDAQESRYIEKQNAYFEKEYSIKRHPNAHVLVCMSVYRLTG